jgi:hypothetical protein
MCTLPGDGPYDFMLDSGLTAELITPELRRHLGIKDSKGKVAGLAAGGASAAGDLVRAEESVHALLLKPSNSSSSSSSVKGIIFLGSVKDSQQQQQWEQEQGCGAGSRGAPAAGDQLVGHLHHPCFG